MVAINKRYTSITLSPSPKQNKKLNANHHPITSNWFISHDIGSASDNDVNKANGIGIGIASEFLVLFYYYN